MGMPNQQLMDVQQIAFPAIGPGEDDKWRVLMDSVARVVPGGWKTMAICCLVGLAVIGMFVLGKRIKALKEMAKEWLKK